MGCVRCSATNMSKSKYACDFCHSRKVACSRDISGCGRCAAEDVSCVYSRSGIIRRNRPSHKHKQSNVSLHEVKDTQIRDDMRSQTVDSPTSQLTNDIIAATREDLERRNDGQRALGALSSFSTTYASIWQESNDLSEIVHQMDESPNRPTFYAFEEAAAWVEMFQQTLRRGDILFSQVPSSVINHLSNNRPDLVHERAWLVMFYGIILTTISSSAGPSTDQEDQTRRRLQHNLWLALNDVRILLEPSELNIQALLLLATHVQEFTTPSLSWMLVTNACRMLQALGINAQNLDSTTRERRIDLYWNLNVLDKTLALIFGRPPTFHRGLAYEVPITPMTRLMGFQPHLQQQGSHDSVTSLASVRAGSLFGAHYLHQMHLLSKTMAEVWSCTLEGHLPGARSVETVREELEEWFREAMKVLDAAILTETPLLDETSKSSIHLGLAHVKFQYYHLKLLLLRSRPKYKEECLAVSHTMLDLLEKMVSDSEECYNGVVWHLLYCPFMPSFLLFGRILSGEDSLIDENKALQAMESFAVFLDRMTAKHPQALKLKGIAEVFVQKARAVLGARTDNGQSGMRGSHKRKRASDNVHRLPPGTEGKAAVNATKDFQPLLGLFDRPINQFESSAWTGELEDTTADRATLGNEQDIMFDWPDEPYDFFADSNFDWFAWENSLPQ